MTTEIPQPPQPPTTPPPFDADRISDLFDAMIDDYQYAIQTAKEDGLEAKSSEAGWDRIGSYKRVVQKIPAGDMTAEQYLEFLEGIAERKLADMQQNPSEKQTAELRAIRGTINFIKNDIQNPSINNIRVDGYRKRQEKMRQERLAKLKATDQTNSAEMIKEVKAEVGLDNEQLNKELIAQVIKVCGAKFFTSWPQSLTPSTSGGFFEKPDGKYLSPMGSNGVTPTIDFLSGANHFQTKKPENRGKRIDQAMADLGITEVLYIEPIETDIIESQTVFTEKQQGGILGFGKKTVRTPQNKQIVTGKQPLPTSELVKNGGDEACYRLSYTVASRDMANKYSYKAPDGRFGQTLNAEILLPKKLAIQVTTAIREDPNFLHQLIDGLAINDISIPKEVWENGAGDANGHPLRPPYEQWREADGGKSKMYLVEKSQIQDQIDSGTVDFDEQFVVEF